MPSATLPAISPTAATLLSEAQRMVPIKMGEEREIVPMMVAVVRALGMKAAGGGVLAMRTYLEVLMMLEERAAQEKQQTFDFWHSYVQKARPLFDDARGRGEPAPAIWPHPDDIILDYATLSVAFVGPMDAEDAVRTERLRRIGTLMFEMAIYTNEEIECDAQDLDTSRIGIFMLLWWQAQGSLPPRLCGVTDELHEAISQRSMGRRSRWKAYLEAESQALGLPFVRPRKPLPAWTIRELKTQAAGYRMSSCG